MGQLKLIYHKKQSVPTLMSDIKKEIPKGKMKEKRYFLHTSKFAFRRTQTRSPFSFQKES